MKGKSHGLHGSGVLNIQFDENKRLSITECATENSQDVIGHPSG